MSRPVVKILVGPIASGKSTWCKMAADDGFIFVNDDAIVQAVHAGDYTAYDESLKPVYKSIENQILQVSLAMGRSVVIDRPNCTLESRKRYISLAKSIDARTMAIVFPVESFYTHAFRRYQHDSRGLSLEHWERVAREQVESYQVPCKRNEDFDVILPAGDFSRIREAAT